MTDTDKPDKNDKEPILKRGLIVGFVGAVVELFLVFGVDLSAEQIGAINTLGVLVVTMGLAFWARRKAFSPATIANMWEELQALRAKDRR